MKLLRQNSQVNNSNRIIALILFFAMVLSLTASFSAFGIEEQPALISPQFVGTPGIDDIPFCIDEDVITDAEHTVRLRYLETEDNVAAFSNPDGSATMYYFSNPIKYTDIYGNTVDIDNGKQQGIRDDRFYWVSSDDQFLTKSDARPDIIYSGQARDYTLLKQRFLFTFDEEKGKYRISTENAPTTYLTVSGSYLVGSSLSSSNNQLWHIGCTNNGYYFIISAGDTSKSLALNNSIACLTTGTITSWTFEKCPTFYGQRVNVMNGFEYWDSTNLDNLFFPSHSNVDKREWPFFTYDSEDHVDTTTDDDIMTEGCVICSYAMVLDNLGAKSSLSKFDIRTGVTGFMIPDPFTTMYANTNWATISLTGGNYVSSYNGSPISANHTNLVEEFNHTTGSGESLASLSTTQAKGEKLIQLLEQHPEGIIVRVGYNQDPINGKHSIVITAFTGNKNTTYSTDEWNSKFIVYDPSARTIHEGNGAYWKDCRTYDNYGGIENALEVRTIVRTID